MKTTIPFALSLALLAAGACVEEPTGPGVPGPSLAAGNGFPQGAHDYRLNIIGVDHDKSADMDDNNGRRIFVRLESDNVVTNPGGKNNHLKLSRINQIFLQEGEFNVLDANATDSDGALFQLPDPDANDDLVADYRVYVRALGKPGGSSTVTTCADEEDALLDGDDLWCSVNQLTVERKKGRPKVQDATTELLSITIFVDPDLDPGLSACLGVDDVEGDQDPVEHTLFLFDNCLENYFWNYNNNGLRLLEVRFYL